MRFTRLTGFIVTFVPWKIWRRMHSIVGAHWMVEGDEVIPKYSLETFPYLNSINISSIFDRFATRSIFIAPSFLSSFFFFLSFDYSGSREREKREVFLFLQVKIWIFLFGLDYNRFGFCKYFLCSRIWFILVHARLTEAGNGILLIRFINHGEDWRRNFLTNFFPHFIHFSFFFFFLFFFFFKEGINLVFIWE